MLLVYDAKVWKSLIINVFLSKWLASVVLEGEQVSEWMDVNKTWQKNGVNLIGTDEFSK